MPGRDIKPPNSTSETAEGASRALENPNPAVRYLAFEALGKLGSAAEPALLRLWQGDNPRHRARALWLLGKLPMRGEQYLQQALADDDPDIRITAVRLARRDKKDLLPIVRQLLNDPSPQVRRELLLVLRHHPEAEAAPLWAELALQHDGQDRWYLEALGIAADRQWDLFFDAWLAKIGSGWHTPAGRDIVWRSRAEAALPLLAEIIKASPPEEHLRYFRAFDFHTDNQENKERALESILLP